MLQHFCDVANERNKCGPIVELINVGAQID